MLLKSDAVRGFTAAAFFAPRFGFGASMTSPVAGSTAAAASASGSSFGHVRPEPAVLHDDLLAVVGVLAEHAVALHRCVDELARLRLGELVGCEVLGEVDAAGRSVGRGIGVDRLEVGAVLADAQRDVGRDRAPS